MASFDRPLSTTISPQQINLPQYIGDLKLHTISWNNFKGKIPNNAQYSAHIYWNIDYELCYSERKKKHLVKVNVKILSRSWSIVQNRKQHLLMHQYGHYLIGCLCALAFQKKVNVLMRQPLSFGVNDWCRAIFRQTLDQYLKLQKLYDDETQHRLNYAKQEQWQKMLIKSLQLYQQQLMKTKQKQFKIQKLPKIKAPIKVSQA